MGMRIQTHRRAQDSLDVLTSCLGSIVQWYPAHSQTVAVPTGLLWCVATSCQPLTNPNPGRRSSRCSHCPSCCQALSSMGRGCSCCAVTAPGIAPSSQHHCDDGNGGSERQYDTVASGRRVTKNHVILSGVLHIHDPVHRVSSRPTPP